MGTEVLRPQDLMVERFHVSPPSFNRRRNFSANGNLTNLVVNRRPSNNAGHRRTSPKSEKKRSNDAKKVAQGGAAEAGRIHSPTRVQVTILRRGESLDSLTARISGGGNTDSKSPRCKPADDLAVLGTGRIRTDSTRMVPKLIHVPTLPLADVYAGSAVSQSPSPSSLPLPSFFNKKQDDIKASPFNDPATTDLRRLLRLD